MISERALARQVQIVDQISRIRIPRTISRTLYATLVAINFYLIVAENRTSVEGSFISTRFISFLGPLLPILAVTKPPEIPITSFRVSDPPIISYVRATRTVSTSYLRSSSVDLLTFDLTTSNDILEIIFFFLRNIQQFFFYLNFDESMLLSSGECNQRGKLPGVIQRFRLMGPEDPPQGNTEEILQWGKNTDKVPRRRSRVISS